MHAKVGNILTISLTRHLKNVVLVSEMLQNLVKVTHQNVFLMLPLKVTMFENVPLTFVQLIIFSQNIQK